MKIIKLLSLLAAAIIIASCGGDKKSGSVTTIDSMTVKPKAGTIDSMTVVTKTTTTIDSMTVKPK